MRKHFDKSFQKLIKTYTLVFVLTFVSYTFLNWFLTTKTKDLEINEKYVDFWIPLAVCAIITYIIFRPLIKQVKFKAKAADFCLWFLLPFSIGMCVAFSQHYFKDKSYSMITVDKPTDILQHPDEKFFKIKNFFVAKDHYFIIRERHTTGRYGTTLVVSNYFTSAMYDDSSQVNQYSKIAYGVRFSKSMHNGLFNKDSQQPIIEKFNFQSNIDYNNYNFYDVDLFERAFNSDDATYFKESWRHNLSSDKSIQPIVITKMTRTLSQLYENDWNMVIYSVLICYFVTMIFLMVFNFFKY